MPFVEFHETKDRGIGPHVRDAISRADAIDALRTLLALRDEGLRRPLPFAPYSAWELFSRDEDVARGLREAAKKWRGSGNGGWAEGDGETLQLALRGRDPFVDGDAMREFARIAGIVFGATSLGVAAPIDIGNAAVPEDDAEDAA